MSDDHDDLDWEEFLSLSEAQQDARLPRHTKEYGDMLDRLAPRDLYRYRRRRTLDLCLKQRRIAREFPGVEIFGRMLKSSQKRLLKWRIEYRTGAVAGHA